MKSYKIFLENHFSEMAYSDRTGYDTDIPKMSDEEFFNHYNLDIEDTDYLGSGDNGEAYIVHKIDEDTQYVLKKTTSKEEEEIAREIMDVKSKRPSALSNVVDIYGVAEVGRYTYILQEYLDEDGDIEDMFYTLSSMAETQGVGMFDFDPEDYEEETGEEVDSDIVDFGQELYSVLHDYKTLGIQHPDIQPDNLGRDSDGKLKAFDLDERG
jgi:serine/threonine protein kinase